MKNVQVVFDEDLLARLDASEEVKKHGRSAVLRRATEEYLRRRRSAEIAERYAVAYRRSGGLGTEFADWEEQGEWPAT